MKTFGILSLTLGILFIGLTIFNGIKGTYELNNSLMSYWNLADKSSTIVKKSEYIDKFVGILEKSGFEGKYHAIILPTPDNSFDQNFVALKSLQQRLHEVQGIDITSFAYQTAIQQITAQEQGEAEEMLKIFKGVWWKDNHPLLWDWICGIQVLFSCGLIILGLNLWGNADGW